MGPSLDRKLVKTGTGVEQIGTLSEEFLHPFRRKMRNNYKFVNEYLRQTLRIVALHGVSVTAGCETPDVIIRRYHLRPIQQVNHFGHSIALCYIKRVFTALILGRWISSLSKQHSRGKDIFRSSAKMKWCIAIAVGSGGQPAVLQEVLH